MMPRLGPFPRACLVTVAWGVMTSAVLLAFIFQGYFVPGFRAPYRDISGFFFLSYALIFLVAFVSGMLLSEFSAALGSFFASLGVAAVTEYLVLTLPSALGLAGLGVLAEFGIPPLSDLAIAIVFYSLFPVTLLLGFSGAIAGVFFGERYLD